MANKGYRSIEITITNNSNGEISVASNQAIGRDVSWIDGEEPTNGDTIGIGQARTYGASTPRNYNVSFHVSFEGIGFVELTPTITSMNKPTCPWEADTGIDVGGSTNPIRADDEHVSYNISISGTATSRRIGLSAEELKSAQ